VSKESRYILKKANWKLFFNATRLDLEDVEINDLTVDEMVNTLNHTIVTAADLHIPKSSDRILPRRIVWWTPECTRLNIERKHALRRYQRSGLIADKIINSRNRATARCKKKNIRTDSWKGFVSTINVDTPITKIWSRAGKMIGKYKQRTSPYLIQNNSTITDETEVANILAHHYQQISSSANYSPEFKIRKHRMESRPPDFSENEPHNYNSQITIREITGMLQQCKKTAPGEDKIQYIMLENIHPSLLKFLQDLFNKIYQTRTYPQSWRCATVLSFLKPNKDRTNTTSYRVRQKSIRFKPPSCLVNSQFKRLA
jgi:hypothetical protein